MYFSYIFILQLHLHNQTIVRKLMNKREKTWNGMKMKMETWKTMMKMDDLQLEMYFLRKKKEWVFMEFINIILPHSDLWVGPEWHDFWSTPPIQIFWGPTLFSEPRFFWDPNLFWDPPFLGGSTFFSGTSFFSGPKYFLGPRFY